MHGEIQSWMSKKHGIRKIFLFFDIMIIIDVNGGVIDLLLMTDYFSFERGHLLGLEITMFQNDPILGIVRLHTRYALYTLYMLYLDPTRILDRFKRTKWITF